MIRKGIFLVAYLVGLVLPFTMGGAEATAFQLIATKDEYHSKLEGKWTVATKVVWSDCPYVKIGTESESEITINNINGNLYPSWKANDWKLMESKAIDFNTDNSLYWEISSFLEKKSEYCYVETVKKFDFTKHGKFNGTSHNKQFLNGEYVGAYITESQLTKKEDLRVSQL